MTSSKTILADNTERPSRLGYRAGVMIRVVAGVTVGFLLYMISRDSYVFYHDLVETFSILIAFGIFLIIWNSYRHLTTQFFTVLAIGIAFSAFFDLLHLLTYKGMSVFELGTADTTNLATQLWLVARFIQAGAYLAAGLYVGKANRWKVTFVYLLVSILFLVSIFEFHTFPVAYTGQLTLFKKLAEYFISAIFLASALFVYLRRKEFDKFVYELLLSSMVVTVVSELSFTLYRDPYGAINFSGHILKVFAFYLLYRAIIVTAIERPHDFLFRQLISDEKHLRRHEEELRVANAHLKREYSEVESLIASIGDGIVAMDREGAIQHINPAFCGLVDLSADEIMGKNIFDVLRYYDDKGQLVPKSERPLWVVLKRDKFSVVRRSSYHSINSAGQKVDLSVTAAPVIVKGKPVGGVAVIRDVTKEKDIERTKLEYISFAAHQLRTPLATMRLTVEVIASELKKKKPKDVEFYLNDTIEEIDEMSKTVDHFLNVTKIEAGLLPIRPVPTSVERILTDHLRLLSAQIERKNIQVETHFSSNLSETNIDPQALNLILDNLLTNAIKYTREGGTIKVGATIKNRKLLIHVSDTGFGIPKADQSSVFHKMFRASNTSKSEGTGLGLYIVRLLVRQTGGKIWFESSDKGTVFYVSYPATGMKRSAIRKPS